MRHHLALLIVTVASARQSNWPVAWAQDITAPTTTAASVSNAGGGERFPWLFGGVRPDPVVCEESFDATVSGGAYGASRCTVITGSLVVSGGLPGRFVNGASSWNLQRVEGDFIMRENPVETSLRGAFPGLIYIGGDLVIQATRLVYLSIFPALVEVKGSVQILDNARLLAFHDAETAAFPALLSVGGDVEIRRNAAKELDGFHALRRVGANPAASTSQSSYGVVARGSLVISDSFALESLARTPPKTIKTMLFGAAGASLPSSPPSAFHVLEAVRGDVEISRNDGLRTITGVFRRLVYVTGDIRVERNPLLLAVSSSFAHIDAVGGALHVVENPSLAKVSNSFTVLRAVGGDARFAGNVALTAVDAGTLNGLVQVGGSLVVAQSRLVSLSFLFSLAGVLGDVSFSSNPELRSLDGLQNVRYVGGGYALQGLEGNFGRCGAMSEKRGVTHDCYARQYRFCQPIVDNQKLASGASSMVPGWYRCVDSIMTVLLQTPELKSTAAIVVDAGLADALQTPRAALTVFAPTDVAWLKSFGRLDAILARAGAGADAAQNIVYSHVVRGARPLHTFIEGDTVHTLLLGLALKVSVAGIMPMSPVKITRCRAQPGVWDACTADAHRKVELEPFAWLPFSAGQLIRDTYYEASSTDELLAAYQRSALDAVTTNVNAGDGGKDASAEPPTGEAAAAATVDIGEVTLEEAKAAAWARTAHAAHPNGARVVLGNVKAGNGYVHAVDRSIAPGALLAPAPPPRPPGPRAPPGEQQQQQLFSALLVTSPPPSPAVYMNAPPPTLTPLSSYWQARPPPPGAPWGGGNNAWSRSPPPGAGGVRRGSCRAKEPDICGLCDYTYQDDPVNPAGAGGGGVCCCDPSCLAPENDDCCEDYQATCGGGAGDAFRVRDD